MGTASNGKHGKFGPINGLNKPKRGKGISKKKCFPDVVTMFVIIRVRGFESQGVVLLLLVLLVCCWLDVGMLGESYDDASHSREHSLIEII